MSETDTAASPADLRLPSQLLIDSISDLKLQLEPLLDKPGKVVLDAAEVERTHTAALQLFCLFCRDRSASGREVEFARPSAALRSAAGLLGAASLLHLTQGGV